MKLKPKRNSTTPPTGFLPRQHFEGPQYRMGEMVITGFSVEAEKRLRRAWQIAPGQVFDDGYFEKHTKKLAKPSRDIFGELPIHYNEFGHCLRPNRNPQAHRGCVLLDFK